MSHIMQPKQLLFFPLEEPDDKIHELGLSLEKVRKGMFHKVTTLGSKVNALEEKINALEHQIWVLEGLLKKSS